VVKSEARGYRTAISLVLVLCACVHVWVGACCRNAAGKLVGRLTLGCMRKWDCIRIMGLHEDKGIQKK
jgi:hypothetical protein